jgi:uncharacterized membrane protein YbhN (UPF0104 family)
MAPVVGQSGHGPCYAQSPTNRPDLPAFPLVAQTFSLISDRFVAAWRRPRVRLGINLACGLLATGALLLAARDVAGTGWPLQKADPLLAVGWQRLFASDERPRTVALAVSGAAACVTGVALPGRFDDVVRIAVARKAGCRSCVKTLCLSLFLLGLVDAVALAPLASTGAGFASNSALRAGLAIVAAGGVGAAVVLLALPRLTRSRRLSRFRVSRWLADHVTNSRDALSAGLLVSGSWLVRSVGLLLLLGALGIGFSFPLAILFLTGAAASSALPIAPAGAATQVGAGAAVLVASGVKTSAAVAFALSAQLLVIFAAVAVVGGFVVWRIARRVHGRFVAFQPA